MSVVTFAAGSEALRAIGMAPAGFMVAVLALMETPAILTGLWLAKRGQSEALAPRGGLWDKTCFKGLVVLLIGSFIIGVVAGEKGLAPIAPVFDTLFKGRLCLFLLDMGMVAERRLIDNRALRLRTAALALALPATNDTLGASLGVVAGLDAGTAAALGILAGSGSYIAVPAVMPLALPEANPRL